MKIKKNTQSMYEENVEKKHVIIEDFNTFMYNHTLHRRKNHFCFYFLQAFST